MAANHLGIERVLIHHVLIVDSVTPASLPNSPLTDSQKPDGVWLSVTNLRATSVPITLGDAGQDDHRGILQINISQPKGRGSGDLLAKADEFTDYFTAGKALLYDGQQVRVLSVTVGPGRTVDGYYRVNVDVNYYARTTRI